MTPAELRLKYAALPSWRKPLGIAWSAKSEAAAREHSSLCDAIRELTSDLPQTLDDLLEAVREDWGACSADELRGVVAELVDDRELRRAPDGTITKQES